MKVFKFGGASIESVERVKKVADIISKSANEPMVIVISAMGKTTNALEELVKSYYIGETEKNLIQFKDLEQQHALFAEELLGTRNHPVFEKLKELLTEIEWTLNEKPIRAYNYYYDQIVSVGELLSTTIISGYLNQIGISNLWLDVRDLLRTDDTFREAKVDWGVSEKLMNALLMPAIVKHNLVLTQGFIGSTDENLSTTLGREGSDFTAAIVASIMRANSVTIWKDVPALLNADPKQFSDTVAIHEISYREVIEMAFYGAQVIHPKTIKPLQNNNIPLFVKCFFDDSLPGTTIRKQKDYIAYPPMLVWKKNQVLIELSTIDFSFINEYNLSNIYDIFHKQNVKMNIIQNAAIGFAACIDNDELKIEKLIFELSKDYKVKHSVGLELLTIRHYEKDEHKDLVGSKTILLKQQTRTTLKYVLK